MVKKDFYHISPPRCNRGEILAHAFGTCDSRAIPRDAKAMARAKPQHVMVNQTTP